MRGFYEGILSFWPLFITNIPVLYSRFMRNVIASNMEGQMLLYVSFTSFWHTIKQLCQSRNAKSSNQFKTGFCYSGKKGLNIYCNEHHNFYLVCFRPHCESTMESPSSATSSLLSYDRSSLKLENRYRKDRLKHNLSLSLS